MNIRSLLARPPRRLAPLAGLLVLAGASAGLAATGDGGVAPPAPTSATPAARLPPLVVRPGGGTPSPPKPPISRPDGGVPAPPRPPLALPDGGAPLPPRLPVARPDGGTLAPPRLPAVPSGGGAERLQWLDTRIDEILGVPSLAAARVSVCVVEVETGKSLYRHNDSALLNAASNVKLVTTAAALSQLGPEFRWRTQLIAESVRGGEVEGNLYLQGRGDPSLGVEDLWKLVSDLAAAGVRRVRGDLVLDDTYFDDVRVGPGFDQKSEDYPYRSPSGGLSLNYNAVAIRVLPAAKEGAPVRVVLEPASPYFTVINHAVTIPRGASDLRITTAEVEGHTAITVDGTLRAGTRPEPQVRRICHPDLFTGWTLRELLLRRGIRVGGAVVRGPAPERGRVLALFTSSPLGVQAREVNKRSNNFMAEQILKTLGAESGGRPGSWAKGVDAVARYLASLGIAREQYKMTNGSGLYDSNRFSASQIVTLLRAAYRDFRYAADFVGSLALAGADGTIGRRLGGSPAERWVRAKTGTLDGVSALSGYAGGRDRSPLAFSILINQLTEPQSADARRAQDAIAEALVAYLGNDGR